MVISQIFGNRLEISVPKSRKDNFDPENYRSISLTSCLCKTIERMTNDRFIWYLETNKLSINLQYGFIKKGYMLDHLIHLETTTRDTFVQKEHFFF